MVSGGSKRGFGAWCGTDYFYGCWGGYSVSMKHNAHQEPALETDNIKVHEGNINVYGRCWLALRDGPIFMGRSKNKLCMSWLRELYWTGSKHNIELHASYIRSEDNVLADQLSRLPYKGYLNRCITTLAENYLCCSLSMQCPGEVCVWFSKIMRLRA